MLDLQMCLITGALASCALAQGPGAPLPPTVLKDVPRVGYDIHLCPFPGSLYALLEYTGEPCDYDYIMGVSGACFRRIWNRDDGGNVDLSYLDPEPKRRIFEALGYEWHTVPLNRTLMVDAIKQSVAEGRPVLSFGFIGPPEAGLITGYDMDGDTVYGWSYFQEDADKGYYRVEDWFGKISQGPPYGLIVVGEQSLPEPTDRETLTSSLEWAIDLAHRAKRPSLPDHICGLAAYDAWADSLEVDADYPADDAETMATRAMVHCDQVVMLHERQRAAEYLRRMAGLVPEVSEPLTAAAGLYEQVGQAAGLVWKWGNWMEPAALQGLADPQTRREFAAAVRGAREAEGQAVALLEQALATLRGGQEGLPILTHLELQGSKLINYPPELRPNIEGMRVASALRAMMEFVGQDFGFTENGGWRTNEAFPFFMGAFGEAFEFRWFMKPGLPSGPGQEHSFGDLPGRLTAALAAGGFGCEVLTRPEGGLDAKALQVKVVEAIADRGLPVLLFDVPRNDWMFLATGHDDAGGTLVGWDLEGGDDRGIDFSPQRRRECTDWAGKASAVVFLTTRGERPDEKAAYRAALEQGAVLLCETERGNELTGVETFNTCAERLADPTLNAEDAETVQRRQDLLHPLIWDLATRRHYGNLFLARAAELLPEARVELQAAAQCFRAEHDMMWEIMRIAGGEFPGGPLPKLGDPQVRESCAVVILKSRDKDLQAAGHIEAALEAMR